MPPQANQEFPDTVMNAVMAVIDVINAFVYFIP
jgi:hypothetical protein